MTSHWSAHGARPEAPNSATSTIPLAAVLSRFCPGTVPTPALRPARGAADQGAFRDYRSSSSPPCQSTSAPTQPGTRPRACTSSAIAVSPAGRARRADRSDGQAIDSSLRCPRTPRRPCRGAPGRHLPWCRRPLDQLPPRTRCVEATLSGAEPANRRFRVDCRHDPSVAAHHLSRASTSAATRWAATP